MTTQIDPGVAVAIVAIIAAIGAATVTIINALSEMKVKVATIEKSVSAVHTAVDGTSTALKEQNDRLTVEAARVSAVLVAEAYERGVAQGTLQALREAGVIRPNVPTAAAPPTQA